MPKYIDADSLVRDFTGGMPSADWHYWQYSGKLVVELIERQPAADVAEVRHGRWVRAGGMMPPEAFGVYECSLCGYMQDYHIPTRMREKTPFCPGCGADLREDKDG